MPSIDNAVIGSVAIGTKLGSELKAKEDAANEHSASAKAAAAAAAAAFSASLRALYDRHAQEQQLQVKGGGRRANSDRTWALLLFNCAPCLALPANYSFTGAYSFEVDQSAIDSLRELCQRRLDPPLPLVQVRALCNGREHRGVVVYAHTRCFTARPATGVRLPW